LSIFDHSLKTAFSSEIENSKLTFGDVLLDNITFLNFAVFDV